MVPRNSTTTRSTGIVPWQRGKASSTYQVCHSLSVPYIGLKRLHYFFAGDHGNFSATAATLMTETEPRDV